MLDAGGVVDAALEDELLGLTADPSAASVRVQQSVRCTRVLNTEGRSRLSKLHKYRLMASKRPKKWAIGVARGRELLAVFYVLRASVLFLLFLLIPPPIPLSLLPLQAHWRSHAACQVRRLRGGRRGRATVL